MNNFVVEYDVNLKKLNTYGSGGIARYLFHPRNIEELIAILKLLKERNVKWYILGGGSNVILPEGKSEIAIIKLDLIEAYVVNENTVYVSSGMLLPTFINKMLESGFVNLAPLMGIPGTVGGAIIDNAGSFGTDIFSNIIDVTFLNSSYEVVKISRDNIKYGYRYSEFKDHSDLIILGATFFAEAGDVYGAKAKIQENMMKRVSTQPLEFKNAGSVFKNPPGFSAGALIEECDIKGFNINDAKISEKHANFIVNTGNATSNDIIELIEFIQDVVYKKKGIKLELEQIIVKW